MEVAISCGALSCKSPSEWSSFAAAEKCALRHVLSGLVQHLGGVHNVPPAVEVAFLPTLQCKDCFVHPSRHVMPVLCKAVGENDASTCTDGVEQCGRKEVAAFSGQRVLEGFHHSNVRWLCHVPRALRVETKNHMTAATRGCQHLFPQRHLGSTTSHGLGGGLFNVCVWERRRRGVGRGEGGGKGTLHGLQPKMLGSEKTT